MATGGNASSGSDGGDRRVQHGVKIEIPRHSEVVATVTEEVAAMVEDGGNSGGVGGDAIIEVAEEEGDGVDRPAPVGERCASMVGETSGSQALAEGAGSSGGGDDVVAHGSGEVVAGGNGEDRLALRSSRRAPVVAGRRLWWPAVVM